eukprot:gene13413-9229_t
MAADHATPPLQLQQDLRHAMEEVQRTRGKLQPAPQRLRTTIDAIEEERRVLPIVVRGCSGRVSQLRSYRPHYKGLCLYFAYEGLCLHPRMPMWCMNQMEEEEEKGKRDRVPFIYNMLYMCVRDIECVVLRALLLYLLVYVILNLGFVSFLAVLLPYLAAC